MSELILRKNPRKVKLNDKYGELEPIEYAGHIGKDMYYYCKCSCGEIKPIRIRTLKCGQKTCGKCRFKQGSNHHAWRGHGEISKNLFNAYKFSARDRNLEFKITLKYIWNLFVKQKHKCALTGWDLYFNPTYTKQANKTASLDRIDSEKGYIKGNLQWVHKDINKLKKNLPDKYFIEICKAVAKHQNMEPK